MLLLWTPQCQFPVKVDSSMPVNVAPRAYVTPADVASGECVMPVRVAPRESVTRVYSARNWTWDARNAHTSETERRYNFNWWKLQVPSSSRVEQSDVALGTVLSSPMTASENKGIPKPIPSRRNWKAEARNKKNYNCQTISLIKYVAEYFFSC
ncbi:putative transcription factor MYC2-like [Capsicum annuum]|nr:putative transcription factor MYC2-like [Capsicum annuum]